MVKDTSSKICTLTMARKVILIALPFVVILVIGIVAASVATPSVSVQRVIVDVDAGPDDAWALYHLLSSDHVHVLAISCVKGNTNVTNVGRNVLRILTAMGKEHEIPVYLGSNERLIGPEPVIDPKDKYFGDDGFSDIDYSQLPAPDMTILQPNAIEELTKLFKMHPSEITYINLGPLTNLALLLKVHPETRSLIKQFLIMGGNRHGVGNTESAAEFNFYSDPESANIVINSYPGSITVLPWETASRENLVMNQTWRFETLGNTSNTVIQILNPAERKPLHDGDNWMPCDLLVAMAFTNPELITEKKQYNGNVELHGWLTRGQLVLDHAHEGTGSITIIDNMDQEEVKRILVRLAA